MNIKICPKCGMQHNNINICTNCGSVLNNSTVEQKGIPPKTPEANKVEKTEEQLTPEQQREKDKKDSMMGNALAVLSMMLIFGGVFFVRAFIVISQSIPEVKALAILFSLCPIGGLITLIIGCVKYPKSKILKVFMWLIIIIIVITLISTLIFAYQLIISCVSCLTQIG